MKRTLSVLLLFASMTTIQPAISDSEEGIVDLYEMLEIEKSAEALEISEAIRNLPAQFQSENKFVSLENIKAILLNETTREAYDMTLHLDVEISIESFVDIINSINTRSRPEADPELDFVERVLLNLLLEKRTTIEHLQLFGKVEEATLSKLLHHLPVEANAAGDSYHSLTDEIY